MSDPHILRRPLAFAPPGRPRTLALALLQAAHLAALSGCAIHGFDVQPRTICSGDEVTLRWDASGRTRLVQAGTASSVAGTGSETQRLTADRTYQLQVLGDAGTVTESSAPITVRVAPEAYTIALGPVCDGSGAVVRWEGDQPADDFDHLVFARQLTNQSGRAARFAKGGLVSELLAPGETGGAGLTGAQVSGHWTAFARAQPNERCLGADLSMPTGPGMPAPLTVVAPSLHARVVVGCGRSRTGPGDGPDNPDTPDKPDRPKP
jgi:hypothetical protein